MISLRHVSKRFGRLQALEDVSFYVPRGAIFGLVGPHGAGKTTCLSILATLQEPDSGLVVINERITTQHIRDTRRIMGYVPESLGLPRGLTVAEYLDYYASCIGIDRLWRHRRVEQVLEQAALADQRGQMIGALPPGARRRLAVASALVHKPLVLICDGPASGLEPGARLELTRLLHTVAQNDTTVLVSSPSFRQMDHLCTHMGILQRGRVLRTGTLDEILKAVRPQKTWLLQIEGDPDRLTTALSRLDYVTRMSVSSDGMRIALDGFLLRQREMPRGALPDEIISLVSASGASLKSVTEENPDLEKAFMDLAEGVAG